MLSWVKSLFSKKKDQQRPQYLGWESVREVLILCESGFNQKNPWFLEKLKSWESNGKKITSLKYVPNFDPKKSRPKNIICKKDIRFGRLKNEEIKKILSKHYDICIDLTSMQEKKFFKLFALIKIFFCVGINPNHRDFYALYVPPNKDALKTFDTLTHYLQIINKQNIEQK
ncbi:MAG: hypothetical protein JJU02_14875 [Cryomorphaceae bacterium]|nr:hypothetical protein [Cryomorphaceae bacterium]